MGDHTTFDVILLNDIMDVPVLGLGTIVCLLCVLCSMTSILLKSERKWLFTSTLWYHTHTKAQHTGINRLTLVNMYKYKYVLTTPVM